MPDYFDLKDRVALVTGAGRGIGRETALQLRSMGARVVAADRDAAALEDAPALWSAAFDVTDEEGWRRTIASIAEREGRLDILVNNAGIILNRPFLQTSLVDLRKVMAVNLESIWMGVQAAAELMTQSAQKSPHGGSIINLSSIYGQVAGPMHAAYCASKGAVRLLTKSLAVEFARNGASLRVNSVHPGPVKTDLGMSGVHDAVAFGRLPDSAAGERLVAQGCPMGRWGETDDVAGVIAFLASDASKFVTGAELTVDGGLTAI